MEEIVEAGVGNNYLFYRNKSIDKNKKMTIHNKNIKPYKILISHNDFCSDRSDNDPIDKLKEFYVSEEKYKQITDMIMGIIIDDELITRINQDVEREHQQQQKKQNLRCKQDMVN